MTFLATIVVGLARTAGWLFFGLAEAVGTLLGLWDDERARGERS